MTWHYNANGVNLGGRGRSRNSWDSGEEKEREENKQNKGQNRAKQLEFGVAGYAEDMGCLLG